MKKWEKRLTVWSSISKSGVSLRSPAVRIARDQEIPVLTDLDLFNENIKKKPVIGVTGTNGKSTVVALIGHLP